MSIDSMTPANSDFPALVARVLACSGHYSNNPREGALFVIGIIVSDLVRREGIGTAACVLAEASENAVLQSLGAGDKPIEEPPLI